MVHTARRRWSPESGTGPGDLVVKVPPTNLTLVGEEQVAAQRVRAFAYSFDLDAELRREGHRPLRVTA